ncbi:MAG: ATP-binding protein [Phycisphaerales bacterium]
MFRGVSLANKCLLLFGAAVVLIICAALAVPWLRLTWGIDDREVEVSRQMVRVWAATNARIEDASAGTGSSGGAGVGGAWVGASAMEVENGRLRLLTGGQIDAERRKDAPVGKAWDTLRDEPNRREFSLGRWRDWTREYVFARAVRGKDGSLAAMVLLVRLSPQVGRDVIVNTVYLLSAGSVALGLAVLVFYLITNRLILSPVRDLRETATRVREGNLDTRSAIHTGDEFEELADSFNDMLVALQEGQRSTRAITSALEDQVGVLQNQNTLLNEANRVKGEFLANVSHELRTPLNSILGFTDLLLEAADREVAAGDDSTRLNKRKKYLENIVSSGRGLLELINGLLEMAKIEAGKSDVMLDDVDLRERCEALVALMRPMADKRGVELKLEVVGEVPPIRTDARKMQQIVFNLVSNAIKFTGDVAETIAAERGGGGGGGGEGATPGAATDGVAGGTPAAGPAAIHGLRAAVVVLRVESMVARGGGGQTAQDTVRISVLDTGPGISPEHLRVIFEKFTQLDPSITRKHSGTGLGLAICKELTHLLQGELQVQSELGRGSMFSVILPVAIDEEKLAETRLESRFRGTLNPRKPGAVQA